MRNLQRNKKTLYYALYKGQEVKYKLDSAGNKIVSWTDNSVTPPVVYYEEEGTESVYEHTVRFKANIALSGGDSQTVDFGVNLADYEAVLVTENDKYPITETSLIWYQTEPTTGSNGYPDPATADYRVIKVSPSINECRYILAKVVK